MDIEIPSITEQIARRIDEIEKEIEEHPRRAKRKQELEASKERLQILLEDLRGY